MPPIISIEWRLYDTNELTVMFDEHIGPFRHERGVEVCDACTLFTRYNTCRHDITAAYRNLTRNLAAVIALAAAAQESLAKHLAAVAAVPRTSPDGRYD